MKKSNNINKELENMSMNLREFEKQRRESILKKGGYAKLEIIIPENLAEEPYSNMQTNNVSRITVAKLLLSIEGTLEQLKKDYAREYVLAKMLFTVETQQIDVNDLDKEDNKEED